MSRLKLTLPQSFLLTFVVSFGLLAALVIWFDNTNLITTNGLWKSMDLEPWIENAPDKKIMAANFIYLPAYAFLAQLLPSSLLIYQKMVVINSLFGGLALAFLFWIVYQLTQHKTPAFLAVIFHFGGAFFLGLNLTSEDIMPGYACFMGAVACMIAFSRNQKLIWLFLSSQLYVLSWLFHWSLMFAAGPPLVLALVCLGTSWKSRMRYTCFYVGSGFLFPMLGAFFTNLSFKEIIWTGKGPSDGWFGFQIEKIWLTLGSMGQSVFGGKIVASINQFLSPSESFVRNEVMAWGLIIPFGVLFIWKVVTSWRDPAWRAAGVVLGGTFLAGQVINVHYYPGDPQFQIQPMAWLFVAFGLLAGIISSKGMRWHRGGAASLFILALVPFVMNLTMFLPSRGLDSTTLGAIQELEVKADPAQTTFVVTAFGGWTTWAFSQWDDCGWKIDNDWSEKKTHFIGIVSEPVRHKHKSSQETARINYERIMGAFQQGKRVVIDRGWARGEQAFVNNLATVSNPEKSRALYQMLKDNFISRRTIETSRWGTFYEIFPKEELT